MGENDERIDLLERLVQHARDHRAGTTSTTARAATPTTSAAASRTRASSTSTTARTAARARSRATRRSPPGPAGWRGPCSATPSSWSSSHASDAALEASAAGSDHASAGSRPRDLRLLHRRHAAADGIPYWDTGAPGLAHLGDWRDRPADPFNEHEPVDSSAAAIAAQGLLRLGPGSTARTGRSATSQAGLTVARDAARGALPGDRPARTRGCCCTPSTTGRTAGTTSPPGAEGPSGESSMWGDYHLRELALYVGSGWPGRALPTRSSEADASVSAALVTGASRGHRPGHRPRPGARRLRRGGELRVATSPPPRTPPPRSRSSASGPLSSGRTSATPRTGQRLVHESYEAFGGIDLLVNNAGVAPAVRADLLEATEESFDRLVAHQPQGPVLPHPAGRPRMIEQAEADARRRRSSRSRR